MTNRQQSAFFLAIVFLFTCGAGLLIYKQYDEYYSQKAAIDLEAADAAQPIVKKISTPSATSNLGQLVENTYKNDQFFKNDILGFEFQCLYGPGCFSEVIYKDQYIIKVVEKDYALSLEVINKIFNPSHILTSSQPLTEITDSQPVKYNGKTWYKFLLPDLPSCSDGFYQTNLVNNKTLQLSYARCEQNGPTYLHDHDEVIKKFLSTIKFTK